MTPRVHRKQVLFRKDGLTGQARQRHPDYFFSSEASRRSIIRACEARLIGRCGSNSFASLSRAQMDGDLRVLCQHVTQAFFFQRRLFLLAASTRW
jgi:hypothetical protein